MPKGFTFGTFLLAVYLVLIVLVLIVLVLVVVLVVLIVLILIIVLVLVIHNFVPPCNVFGVIPWIVYPVFQALSLGLKRKLTKSPAVIAAVIPPAVALRPPVKIPKNPSSAMASRTPFAKV